MCYFPDSAPERYKKNFARAYSWISFKSVCKIWMHFLNACCHLMGSVYKLFLFLIKQKINQEISKWEQRRYHVSPPQVTLSYRIKIHWGIHLYFPKLPIFIYGLSFSSAKYKARQNTKANQMQDTLGDESKERSG